MSGVAVLGALLIAWPAFAAGPAAAGQAAPASPGATPSPYQIFVMEAVLQRAVDHGAETLSQRIHRVLPNMVVLAGMSRARGFRLPDYGVFFDVEVPALRKSIAWSFQMLGRPDPALTGALDELREHVRSVGDAGMRESLEEALKQIEAEMGTMTAPGGPMVSAATASGARPAAATSRPAAAAAPQATGSDAAERSALLQDPEGAYREAVRQALVDAMLDYGGPLSLGPDQWLVVAARDDEETMRLPGEPPESHALTLRIRGRDLHAFHAGQISREEAIKRIEVNQD
jgi:hypothetical protein